MKFENILKISRTYLHKEITKKNSPTNQKTVPPEESSLLASGDSGGQKSQTFLTYVRTYAIIIIKMKIFITKYIDMYIIYS